MKSRVLIAIAAAALASPAAATDPAPSGLTITPSVTCRPGFTTESITLSIARGDAIDAVFVFCRDPSKSKESWLRNLARTRDQMMKGAADSAGREAIRRAFDDHIARERTAG
jgi:hypothetical protein